MGRSFKAARVLQTAKQNIGTSGTGGRVIAAPVWLKALERMPPSEILTRPKPIPHQDPNSRMRKPKNIFKPQRIVHPEDELRRTFFKDHPWELATPRIAVELDGKDAHYTDWSTGLVQPGMQVTGESVVQRQLWIMENGYPERVKIPGTDDFEVHVTQVSKEQAYDIARKEFYTIRQQEQITKRIAIEEARMVGGYFGKNRLEVGMELEDKMYDVWRTWAERQVARATSERGSAYQSFGEQIGAEAAELDDLGSENENSEPPAKKESQVAQAWP